MRLVGVTPVTVTTASATLATLGVSLWGNLSRLCLIPFGTVNWALGGAASGSSATLPSQGLDFPVDATTAGLLQFYGSNVAMTVLQFA